MEKNYQETMGKNALGPGRMMANPPTWEETFQKGLIQYKVSRQSHHSLKKT